MSTKMQVKWRRVRVLELSSKGYSQIEIATRLQVNEATISRDIVYLRQEAKENLEKHIHEIIPEEYQKCMIGMKHNLKQTLEICDGSPDPKIKLEARRIAIDCYRYIMDLCTDANVVSNAMKLITRKEEPINALQTLEKNTEAIEGTTTTTTANGVY
jgi:uncharacterized protein YerC